MLNASTTIKMAKRGGITIPKPLRDSYEMRTGDTFTLIDLGGVFVLSPARSEIDNIANKISAQWADDGESIGTMLRAIREERDKRNY